MRIGTGTGIAVGAIIWAAGMCWPVAVHAQSKCDAALWKVSAKHVKCLAKVYAKAAKTGDESGVSQAVAECDAKYTAACAKAALLTDCSQSPDCSLLKDAALSWELEAFNAIE